MTHETYGHTKIAKLRIRPLKWDGRGKWYSAKRVIWGMGVVPCKTTENVVGAGVVARGHIGSPPSGEFSLTLNHIPGEYGPRK